MAETQCRHFSGYKPCSKNPVCARGSCPHFASVHTRVLVIHLGALGAVLRSTSLLKAVRRKYPKAHITWVTERPAEKLLEGVAEIDRVLGIEPRDILQLKALKFDVALVVDKSLVAAGILAAADVAEVFGFKVNGAGAIIPANPEANEL